MKQRAKEDLVDCSEVKKPCDNPNCPKTRVKRSYDHKNMGEGFIVCGKHESGTPHLHSDTEYPQTAPGSSTSLEHAAFRGGHADIGGGYHDRGLANITFEYMHDRGKAAGAPFRNIPSEQLKELSRRFTSKLSWHQEDPLYNLKRHKRRSDIASKIQKHASVGYLNGPSSPNTEPFYYASPGYTHYGWY